MKSWITWCLNVTLFSCLVLFWPACGKKPAEVAPIPNPAPRTRTATPASPDYPAPTVQVTSEPSTIGLGSQTRLMWQSTNASSVVIDSGVGNVAETGSLMVSPRESTTYTVTAKGPGGKANSGTRVTVVSKSEPVMVYTDIDSLQQAIDGGQVQPVFFNYDKAVLTPAAKRVLEGNARVFRQFPEIGIIIEGHCDERGSEEYNLALGDRRAQMVRDYLIELGGGSQQLESISYGEERPFSPGHDETSWRLNRRAHFVIKR